MFNRNKKLLFFVLLALLPFFLIPVANDANCKNQLSKLTNLELPPESQVVEKYSYITSNRGDCVCFAGVLLKTHAALDTFTEKINKSAENNHYNDIDLIWKSSLSDSLIWMSKDMALQQFPVTANWSFYGSDVYTGIRHLLEINEPLKDNYENNVILFITEQHSNFFDPRCY